MLGGYDLDDLVTWGWKPEFWEDRADWSDTTAMYRLNDLRINYIKKEVGICQGNENHQVECKRDIRNVIPRRLSVSIECSCLLDMILLAQDEILCSPGVPF